MTTSAQIHNPLAIRSFILGGHARFTLVSKKTGARKTFEVERNPESANSPLYFVRLLTGSDNTTDYRYLAMLMDFPDGLRVKRNTDGWGLEACVAFEWLIRQVDVVNGRDLDQCEFWHEGRCCRCGRALTTPESIRLGIGPKCMEVAL